MQSKQKYNPNLHCFGQRSVHSRFSLAAKMIESIKSYFSNKTPKQKWLFLFDWTRLAWEYVGQDFMTDGKLYWRSYILCVLTAIYVTLCPYSVVYHISNRNFRQSPLPLCMLGITVSVSSSFSSKYSLAIIT